VSSPRLPAVSLFTNCGAGDLGYRRAGFRFQVLADIQPRRVAVARLNHGDAAAVEGDLRDTWQEVVETYRRQVMTRPPALLAACPPCQGMSSARSGRGLARDPDAGSRDSRNLLVDVIANVACELSPRVVVVENVLAFLTRRVRHPDTKQPVSAAALLIARLTNDYEPFAMRADLADFGVPQTRRRSFLTFVRRSEPGLARLRETCRTPFPAVTHGSDAAIPQITIGAALSELRAEGLDSASSESAGSGLHAVPVLDVERHLMVASIPPGSGASAWDNDVCSTCGKVDADKEEAHCPSCGGPLARPVTFDEQLGAWRLIKGFRNSSYRRMHVDRPAATITTATGRVGSDYTLHPTENRVLSMLECQHLQTIPREFNWGNHLQRYGHTSLREMIGEAVPPQFTELHGRVLVSLLAGHAPRLAMPTSDKRVQSAVKALAARAAVNEETAAAATGSELLDPTTPMASKSRHYRDR
jgi:DNA (cytosine-5)-methyltransferase 1